VEILAHVICVSILRGWRSSEQRMSPTFWFWLFACSSKLASELYTSVDGSVSFLSLFISFSSLDRTFLRIFSFVLFPCFTIRMYLFGICPLLCPVERSSSRPSSFLSFPPSRFGTISVVFLTGYNHCFSPLLIVSDICLR